MRLRSLFPPWLALLLLSPAIGEVLSGSSPPLELLNPVGLLLLVGLYGCGALLVREIAFRWRKGWPSVLLLGAAYGIVEEGLLCKSFFDPGWMDIGILGSYGRWLGVNWIWTVELIAFHAVFSISCAILLVWLAYPADRDRPWGKDRTLVLLAAVLAFVVLLGHFTISAYMPPLPLTLLAALAAAALAVLAWLWPAPAARGPGRAPGPLPLLLAGCAWSFSLFFASWALPAGAPPPFTFIVLLAIIAAGWLLLARLYGKGAGFTPVHKLALAAGALGFLVLFALLQGLAGVPGMAAVAAVAAALLLLLWRRVGAAAKASAAP